MPNPFLGVRIPQDLSDAIAARIQETGQSRSEIVIEALRLYLGIAPEQARLDSVEERLSAVELELGLGHSVSPHSAPPHLPPNKPEGNENHNA
ncbi:MAG: CopG family ribbon-helix-helix protein [Thainema sp.]